MGMLTGLKIIDLTKVFSGPLATRHFADLGASVIKVESKVGDDSRQFPPLIGNWSGYFEVLNRGKETIVLDLHQKSDLNTFYELCSDADVVVENFSPDVKKRLRIDYSQIKKINPKIIYASISGISQNISRKYYDVLAQAESGLMSLNGTSDDMKNATSIVDAFAGVKLAFAISTALYGRQKTGQGCQIDVSMRGAAFDLLEQNLIATSISHQNPPKVGNHDNAIAPFGIFKSRDKSVVLAIGNDTQWQAFSQFILQNNSQVNLHHFSTNHLRLQNFTELEKLISGIFIDYSAPKLIKILQKLGIPCAMVNSMTDVLADSENYQQNLLLRVSHPIAGKIVVPTGGITFSNQPVLSYLPSPTLDTTIKYLPYDASHENGVVDLLNLCFPSKNISPSSFAWKHFDKFFNSQSIAYVAISGQTICSFVCFTPLEIVQMDGQVVQFYSCAVQATHSSFRRLGLVGHLTKIIESKLGYSANYLGFSNDSGVQIDKHSHQINYQIVGQFARQYVPCLPQIPSKICFTPIKSVPSDKWQHQYFHIHKTSSYLGWRYFRNPKNSYVYYSIDNSGQTVGYLVCTLSKYRIEVADIIFNEHQIKIKDIVNAFSNYAFYKGKLITTYTYLPNILWRNAFPLLSFTKRLGIYLTIKSRSTEFLNHSRWLLQAGDIQ